MKSPGGVKTTPPTPKNIPNSATHSKTRFSTQPSNYESERILKTSPSKNQNQNIYNRSMVGSAKI